MIFSTTVNGIPCQCHVQHYSPFKAAWRDSAGDSVPLEPEDFEYELLTTKGKRAQWLDRYLSPDIDTRLLEEFLIMRQGEMEEAKEAAMEAACEV